MRKIEPELITGMGYIGDNPGVLYRMGGAGEQTVVTGNPALLEGVKGSRITSLTLHGKSTQGSTTGAQLLDINNLDRASGCQNNANVVDGGLSKRNDDVTCPDRYLIDVIPNTIYSISASDFVEGATVQISDMFQRGESESVVDVRIYKGCNQIEFNSNKYNQLTLSFFSGTVNTEFKASYIMLNAGSTALPWEPYTGGAPSPSPSYPQDIESAGQSGEIGIEVGNNGYIQKGTYFLDVRPFSLKKGYTYHIKCEKIITTTINCFVMNEYNKNFKNSAELYNYGYTTKKLTIPNSTGIVDKECMMPKRYDGDGYTFTVKAEGLYLYQAVNAPDKNTDELYIGYAPNILNEEYKKQTLIVPTPDGLPGIPVSSGGNYTDEKGQQWVCDEIDLANGEKVQRCKRDMFILRKSNNRYIAEGILGVSTNYSNVICDKFAYNPNANNGSPGIRSSGNYNSIVAWCENFEEASSTIEVDVTYVLATPIRTPLPPETIAAYKALHTYSPTTTVINDAGAGMSVGYKKVRLRKCMM